jgi:sugar lactone lactonase YvrE
LAGSYGHTNGIGGEARFHDPWGIAVDRAGVVYVTDGNSVRKISPDRVVSTLAGSPDEPGSTDGAGTTARFNSPRDIAVDRNGRVYVADYYNVTVRKITPDGMVSTLAGAPDQFGQADGSGTEARFGGPYGLAVDDSGNVYVGDSDNHTVRRITPEGMVTTLAGSAGQAGSADGIGSEARFQNPLGLAVDAVGTVYLSDWQNGTHYGCIRKVTPDGRVTTVAGQPGTCGSADGMGTAARFSGPSGVAVYADGNLCVADGFNCTIRKVTQAGEVTTFVGQAAGPELLDGDGASARFNQPGGIAVGPGGVLYIADGVNRAVRMVAPDGMVTTLVASVGLGDGTNFTPFSFPGAVAVDPTGDLYVTDANNTVQRVTPEGVVTLVAGKAGEAGSADGIGTEARFTSPRGLALDALGNLYIADQANLTIRRITPNGTVTTLAGEPGVVGSTDGLGPAACFYSPADLALNPEGTALYVTDSGNHTIRKVTLEGLVTTLAGRAGEPGSTDGIGTEARFRWPDGLTVDRLGMVYVADSCNNTIRRIAPDGSVTTLAGSPDQFGCADGVGTAARFFMPADVAADASGALYVSDTLNSTLRRGVPSLPDEPTVVQGGGSVRVAGKTHAQPLRWREALPKAETVEAGQTVTLGTTPQTATAWQWRLVRKPAGSKAELSGSSASNPTFTADVADVYVFELLATNASGHASLRQLQLVARSAGSVRISAFSWTAEKCTVTLDSEVGRHYTLEHTDSLASPAWEGLSAVPGNGGTLTLSDPTATTARRFYRVRVK